MAIRLLRRRGSRWRTGTRALLLVDQVADDSPLLCGCADAGEQDCA